MKKILLAGFLAVAAVGGVSADSGRYQVFQGYIPGSEVGKTSSQSPVVLKVDSDTGETWRLIVTGGNYWWVPVKTGVIKPQASEANPAEGPASPKSE